MNQLFAERLCALRKSHGLTQQALADRLELSRGTIGMYESGLRDPDTKTLTRLADILGCSVDYLLGRTPERHPLTEQILTLAARRSDEDAAPLTSTEIKQIREAIKILKLDSPKS
jgi:transcriptional regulator with XRE-family HTH domain